MKKKKSNRNILAIVFISFIVLFFLKIAIGNFLLKRQGICTKSILTNEVQNFRSHKPALIYNFWVNGEKYDGNSNIEELNKAGDSICVVYLKWYPSINRPTSYFEEKCDCDCK